MMSNKLATRSLLKLKIFRNEVYGVIISTPDVTDKNLSSDSNYLVCVSIYCVITLICPIILISHIAQLLLIRKSYCFRKVRIYPLNMRDIIIYVARWREKYPSKRSPLKHTCSWRTVYELILLWILNRQAKIFLRTAIGCKPQLL